MQTKTRKYCFVVIMILLSSHLFSPLVFSQDCGTKTQNALEEAISRSEAATKERASAKEKLSDALYAQAIAKSNSVPGALQVLDGYESCMANPNPSAKECFTLISNIGAAGKDTDRILKTIKRVVLARKAVKTLEAAGEALSTEINKLMADLKLCRKFGAGL